MAIEEEYEIMSHSRLDKLKDEVEELRKGPSKEMHESVNQLKGSMDQMINLFKVASEEMKNERIEEKGVEKKLGPLLDKIDRISVQQNELAKGMVAIADMVKEHFPKIEHELEDMHKIRLEPPRRKKPMVPPPSRPMPSPSMHEPAPLPPLSPPGAGPLPSPSAFDKPLPSSPGMPPPPGMAPPPPGVAPPGPPGMEPMPPLEPLGPPPTEKPKKKGLLGLFKK